MAFSMQGGTGRMRLGSRMEPSKLQIFRAIGCEKNLRMKAEKERDTMAKRLSVMHAEVAREEAKQRQAQGRGFLNQIKLQVKAFFLRKVV